MRGGFDSLCGIVRNKLERNPTCGEVYVFFNRRRNQVKLLHWEHGGFVLYYYSKLKFIQSAIQKSFCNP